MDKWSICVVFIVFIKQVMMMTEGKNSMISRQACSESKDVCLSII